MFNVIFLSFYLCQQRFFFVTAPLLYPTYCPLILNEFSFWEKRKTKKNKHFFDIAFVYNCYLSLRGNVYGCPLPEITLLDGIFNLISTFKFLIAIVSISLAVLEPHKILRLCDIA